MTYDAVFSQQLSFVQNEDSFRKLCTSAGINYVHLFKASTPEYGECLPIGCAG
jgi:hypothetical protein